MSIKILKPMRALLTRVFGTSIAGRSGLQLVNGKPLSVV